MIYYNNANSLPLSLISFSMLSTLIRIYWSEFSANYYRTYVCVGCNLRNWRHPSLVIRSRNATWM